MPIPLTVERAGLTVERLLFRAYGRPGQSAAMLAETLRRNPHLGALGPALPLGTALTLPDLAAAPAAPARRPGVSLFEG